MQNIEPLLARVTKPGRYAGGELNSIQKDWDSVSARIALIYPDVYEVGMSNLGLQILYALVNGQSDLLAERAFAPWLDMEALMRDRGVRLFSLESRRPLADFDLLGFSLCLELTHTNALNLLDLAGVPVLAEERREKHPIVVAGGSCSYNPEPMAPFFDLFVVGDGEEVLLELMNLYSKMRGPNSREHVPRLAFLEEAALLSGIYIPAFYDRPAGAKPKPRVPVASPSIRARRISRLGPSPLKPVVPFMEAVHDRAMIEVQRGCTRGCRFCQAGIIYRPVRERSCEAVLCDAAVLLDNTGYDEISLVSLSTADYSAVEPVVNALAGEYPRRRVKVSLPSLRVDSFSVKLAHSLHDAYGGGLTFAPEAGTQRLRDVINKGVDEAQIEAAIEAGFAQGWNGVKLYFMVGLPTETAEDVEGIVKLAYRARDTGRRHAGARTRVRVSVGAFIPKPHAPFHWFGQDAYPRIKEKMAHLHRSIRGPGLSVSWNDPESGVLEAALARGNARTAKAIYRAWRLGGRFDAWSEQFSFERWQRAFAEEGLDIHAEAERAFALEEILPWDHIDTGVSKRFLTSEYRRTLRGGLTPDCRWGKCTACGVRKVYGGC